MVPKQNKKIGNSARPVASSGGSAGEENIGIILYRICVKLG